MVGHVDIDLFSEALLTPRQARQVAANLIHSAELVEHEQRLRVA